MIPKNTFADGVRYAALIVGDFDPFDSKWSEEEQRVGERVLDLLHARLNEVADQYATEADAHLVDQMAVELIKDQPKVRVGGEPPELEIGMIIGEKHPSDTGVLMSLVVDLYHFHPHLVEVRAPWGGPVIWRAK